MKQIQLGKKVRVSDPCYGTKVWCAGTIDNVKEGLYNVEVEYSDEGDWGTRVKSILVFHSEFNWENFSIESTDFEVGVDSGQAGIYDEDYYNQYHTEDGCDDDWYDEVCKLTLSSEQFGTKDEKCIVSSSGFGDGGYTCLILKQNEQVVGIAVVFITDEEDEDCDVDFSEEEDEEDE